MRILLDEDVPIQVLDVLRHVLRGHVVDHVQALGWSGKKDVAVLHDAAKAGYQVLVTNDSKQLEDPDETRAIKRSSLHHVTYRQRHHGLRGLAVAMGSLIAGMPEVVERLDSEKGQRLVSIRGIEPRDRCQITDPSKDPPRYWR